MFKPCKQPMMGKYFKKTTPNGRLLLENTFNVFAAQCIFSSILDKKDEHVKRVPEESDGLY